MRFFWIIWVVPHSTTSFALDAFDPGKNLLCPSGVIKGKIALVSESSRFFLPLLDYCSVCFRVYDLTTHAALAGVLWGVTLGTGDDLRTERHKVLWRNLDITRITKFSSPVWRKSHKRRLRFFFSKKKKPVSLSFGRKLWWNANF